MRITREKSLVRVFGRESGEIAYLKFGLTGLEAQIEFPSDWHEYRRAWVRLGFGLIKVCFSFPWSRVVPDEYQCSGPTYGFIFFEDGLHLHWGKAKGKQSDPFKLIQMPWGWRHQERKSLTDKETHPYRYFLKSGEVQERTATIYAFTQRWTRPWIPWKLVVNSIDINFSEEVGERSGSWKGGCTGCSYDMRPGEKPVDTLKRMERERKFT